MSNRGLVVVRALLLGLCRVLCIAFFQALGRVDLLESRMDDAAAGSCMLCQALGRVDLLEPRTEAAAAGSCMRGHALGRAYLLEARVEGAAAAVTTGPGLCWPMGLRAGSAEEWCVEE